MSISAGAARDLLLYMLWADRETLKAVREVRPEDLTRDAGVSFGSLLGTMSHMAGSQRIWLSRFLGQSPSYAPGPESPDLLSWITFWEETASGINAFMAALTDEQLAGPLTWTNLKGETTTLPLWQLIVHLVNHESYHRGQVTSLLRQMGYPPPATDLSRYFLSIER
jgi:uncharacterized damage-inducible protein DinB